jgi:hypothetical protein
LTPVTLYYYTSGGAPNNVYLYGYELNL